MSEEITPYIERTAYCLSHDRHLLLSEKLWEYMDKHDYREALVEAVADARFRFSKAIKAIRPPCYLGQNYMVHDIEITIYLAHCYSILAFRDEDIRWLHAPALVLCPTCLAYVEYSKTGFNKII